MAKKKKASSFNVKFPKLAKRDSARNAAAKASKRKWKKAISDKYDHGMDSKVQDTDSRYAKTAAAKKRAVSRSKALAKKAAEANKQAKAARKSYRAYSSRKK